MNERINLPTLLTGLIRGSLIDQSIENDAQSELYPWGKNLPSFNKQTLLTDEALMNGSDTSLRTFDWLYKLSSDTGTNGRNENGTHELSNIKAPKGIKCNKPEGKMTNMEYYWCHMIDSIKKSSYCGGNGLYSVYEDCDTHERRCFKNGVPTYGNRCKENVPEAYDFDSDCCRKK